MLLVGTSHRRLRIPKLFGLLTFRADSTSVLLSVAIGLPHYPHSCKQRPRRVPATEAQRTQRISTTEIQRHRAHNSIALRLRDAQLPSPRVVAVSIGRPSRTIR